MIKLTFKLQGQRWEWNQSTASWQRQKQGLQISRITARSWKQKVTLHLETTANQRLNLSGANQVCGNELIELQVCLMADTQQVWKEVGGEGRKQKFILIVFTAFMSFPDFFSSLIYSRPLLWAKV